MNDVEKQRDLQRLKEMAANFSEDERKAILSCMPVDELIDEVKIKCGMMLEKLDHVQSLIDQFNK